MSKKIEYTKLDTEKKDKWLSALRSGEYTQARGSLVEPSEDISLFSLNPSSVKDMNFCCIAVGAHACGMSLKELRDIECDPTSYGVEKNFDGGTEAACDFLYLDDKALLKLVNLNDERSFTFKSIANWIEKNL